MQLQAQDKWLNYTNKDQVKSIVVDGDKIWIGSTGGVIVRDLKGGMIEEYTKLSGIASNNIRSVAVDEQGNKWFGTAGSGVSKFDGSTWTTYNISNSGLVHDFVISVTIDIEGNKWFGTVGGGVSKFDGTTWTTYNKDNSGLTSNTILSIAIDGEGNKWFGTQGSESFKI